MSSSGSPSWLTFRHLATASEPSGGRHRAPETSEAVELLTSEQIAAGGRHAEPEWDRPAFDPARDDIDAFDWLGFEAAQD
jgi:hypothetical protein